MKNINVEIDKEFHYKIAECSGNVLIFNILKTVSTLVDHFIVDARKLILAEQGNKEILFSQHNEIYLSMEKHSSEAARKAMREHLDFANRYMKRINNYKYISFIKVKGERNIRYSFHLYFFLNNKNIIVNYLTIIEIFQIV